MRGRKPKGTQTLTDLLNIMGRLRGPSGCPWDKEQTPQTLKKFLIEEAYEVLEAIETGTPEDLREELGDLLLQIIFLSRMAEEDGKFGFFDVVHTLAEKLVRRHPHVFLPAGANTVKAQNPEDVIKVWGAVKEIEGKYAKRRSLLDGIPVALPALERSGRISHRVARAGFDWPNIDAVWKKVEEELGELKRAHRRSRRTEVEAELGDLLFTLVNWARFKDLSAEEALRKTNRRFSARFRRLEIELGRRGKTIENSSLEEMDQIWERVKQSEKNKRAARR